MQPPTCTRDCCYYICLFVHIICIYAALDLYSTTMEIGSPVSQPGSRNALSSRSYGFLIGSLSIFCSPSPDWELLSFTGSQWIKKQYRYCSNIGTRMPKEGYKPTNDSGLSKVPQNWNYLFWGYHVRGWPFWSTDSKTGGPLMYSIFVEIFIRQDGGGTKPTITGCCGESCGCWDPRSRVVPLMFQSCLRIEISILRYIKIRYIC